MAKRLNITSAKVVFLATLVFSLSATAQEKPKFEVSAGADLVSSYVWRGLYQTGAAIQPGLTFSFGGLSWGAWGSTDFSTMAKEFDLSVSYEAGGFSVGLTDYWWAGEGNSYLNYKAFHFIEGAVGYSFGEAFPLSLSASTMLGYDGDKDRDGNQMYSTFLSAGYDFNVRDVALTAGLGISPWTGIYHKAGTEGVVVSTLSLKATKEIQVTNSFTLPVFVERSEERRVGKEC
jgi:hypothetical protein